MSHFRCSMVQWCQCIHAVDDPHAWRMFPLLQVVFPRAGPLGLNLRSYFAVPPAGARPGLPPYGCLEVLEAQSIYLQVSCARSKT